MPPPPPAVEEDWSLGDVALKGIVDDIETKLDAQLDDDDDDLDEIEILREEAEEAEGGIAAGWGGEEEGPMEGVKLDEDGNFAPDQDWDEIEARLLEELGDRDTPMGG